MNLIFNIFKILYILTLNPLYEEAGSLAYDNSLDESLVNRKLAAKMIKTCLDNIKEEDIEFIYQNRFEPKNITVDDHPDLKFTDVSGLIKEGVEMTEEDQKFSEKISEASNSLNKEMQQYYKTHRNERMSLFGFDMEKSGGFLSICYILLVAIALSAIIYLGAKYLFRSEVDLKEQIRREKAEKKS
jgi:hypothetical protein